MFKKYVLIFEKLRKLFILASVFRPDSSQLTDIRRFVITPLFSTGSYKTTFTQNSFPFVYNLVNMDRFMDPIPNAGR